MRMIKIPPVIFLIFILRTGVLINSSEAALKYQDFEANNGTPAKPADPHSASPEYGWGFNGAVVRLSQTGEPVHDGTNSWQVTIPSGPHVVAGSGIPSQSQTYDMNFVPECHDRLTFWIWSNPSMVGDHTVMVKFFDQGKYKIDGIGVWTTDKAMYRGWTPLNILFNQLPKDFDFKHVDKIEFFNYWDGTYYYDDISVGSSFSPEQDIECLKKELVLVCPSATDPSQLKIPNPSDHAPILGLSGENVLCVTTLGEKAELAMDYLQMRIQRQKY